jgi:hypothetical protein
MSSQIFGRSRLLTRSLLPLIGRRSSANRMADAGGSNVILRFIPIPSRALLYIVPNDRSDTWTDRSQVLLQHPPLRTCTWQTACSFPPISRRFPNGCSY